MRLDKPITSLSERLRAQLWATARFLTARGVTLVGLACVVGVIAGALTTAMGAIVQGMHWLLFGLPPGARLSAMFSLSNPWQALVPVFGGAIVGLTVVVLRRRRFRTPIDPIEANALHGGRLSMTDTFIVAWQTIISSGFGASVGLEAAYTQTGSGVASWIARQFGLRRGDVRILVGCGAAGAIAAAFGAPLTGAFYGFELIIGVYSIANLAPVMAAALCASLTASYFGDIQFPVDLGNLPPMTVAQYVPFIILGLLAGAASIGIMRLVTLVELLFGKLAVGPALRPVIGGCVVGLLGLVTPQVLSSGHGGLHRELAMNYGLYVITQLFVLKLLASAVSLGSGFRGGLFFASLFLGALLGKMFAAGMTVLSPEVGIDPTVAAVVGMTSLAVGVVGGPLTMTFLALESSGNLALTGVALAAAIVSALLVREAFGFSFSTWRFHLRGETIRSAQDIGWMRNLTVGSMMREDVRTVPGDITLGEFRKSVPLGSTQRVIIVGPGRKYLGMLVVAEVHGLHPDQAGDKQPVAALAKSRETVLVPTMNVKAAAEAFTMASSEELAVVQDFVGRKVVGLLTEGHMLRRYAEELDKARRDIYGER
ncbi:chloride channel protein [Mesorhizobium sp. KR1-2]|uniref:chloride channel protein n=1 Tax=Mesorhizobium sp. KR1-2 TaxID=3156609 RepID=UPI0032B55ABF